MQLPTGGGKTIVLSAIIAQSIVSKLKCLVLAHREELINQAIDKIETITNEPVGTIKAGIRPDTSKSIQVASVQTLVRRLDEYPDFDLIIIDESHHANSPTYKKILNHYPNARILGVTATPIRLDGKGFRDVFDDLICGITTKELIDRGNLSPYKYFGVERSMSVDGLKKRSGDFRPEDIENLNPVEIVANQVLESSQRHLVGKQVVIFAVTTSQSAAIAEHLRNNGITAHHLDGNSHSHERKSVMQLFRDKKIQVLSNCALFDEGLDIPSLDGVILARPTASVSRYLQMVGRALRVSEGKEHAIVIDLAQNYERLGMPDEDREWSLDGIPKKIKERKPSTKLIRNQTTNEIERIKVVYSNTEFIEITGRKVLMTPELKIWIDICDNLLSERTLSGFKASWCTYRLMAAPTKPPIEVWQYLGKKLGYHHQWAKHKVDEWVNV